MDGAADFRARAEQARQRSSSTDQGHWPEPDMGVLRLHRRPPPPLPLAAFESRWAAWIEPVVAGSVTDRPGRHVSIPQAGLIGRGDRFLPPGGDPPGDPPGHGGAARPPVPPWGDTV